MSLNQCKNLEHLILNYCNSLTDITLINLEGLVKLKTFCIAGYKFFKFN
jgi:hypothetical protein